VQQLRELAPRPEQVRGIVRRVTVQRAVAVRHDHVPRPARDLGALLLEMEAERRAAPGLEVHVPGEPHLLRERLEERRNAPDALVVQVRDRARPPVPHGRAVAERVAVADEQDLAGLLGGGGDGREGEQDESGEEGLHPDSVRGNEWPTLAIEPMEGKTRFARGHHDAMML
jgi:hypothetical protein